MDNSQDEEAKENTRKLITECLQRITDGDPDAGVDLARIFLGQVPCSEAYIPIAVVEALVLQSAQLGSSDAREYLDELWPKMKEASLRRLVRRGMK